MIRSIEELPRDPDVSILARPVRGVNFVLKNALAVQPMEGCDGTADGAPGGLTYRRYERFAAGGAGLLWAEAISVVPEGRANPRQLMLTEENVGAFQKLTGIAHAHGAVIVAQLTHSGRFSRPVDARAPIRASKNPALDALQKLSDDYPVATDDYLKSMPEAYARATRLARKAGFDGVDVKACHLYLYSELLGALNRPGPYGGAYENRVRLLKESVEAAKSELSDDILASRFNLYDGEAGSWGVGEGLAVNLAEPLRLTRELGQMGVALMNLTMGTPYLNPHVNRPYNKGGYVSDEPPVAGVKRLLDGCRAAQAVVPEAVCVATGFSYLGEHAPEIAAALVKSGGARAAGFGRMAFAYPDFANDIIETGKMEKKKCCVTCSLCTKIMRGGGFVGCPVRDPAYKEELKKVMA
jgi:2,4-dienoyl-CoA reductase-like NADH-dependent reductase (Old Yellow Enzyme family)